MIRTSFSSLISSHPFPSLRIYDSRRWKTRIFLSLLSRACGISHPLFFQTPWRFSCLIFQLALRNTHLPVLFESRARDLRRSLSQPDFVSRFRVDNVRFRREMLFEIIAPFRISAWSAAVSSTEKNPACSGLWQRWNTLTAYVIYNRCQRAPLWTYTTVCSDGVVCSCEKYFPDMDDLLMKTFEFANFSLLIRTRI